MTSTQYKNVIDYTLTQLPADADSLTTVREILRNCGTPLPQGTPDQILHTLLSGDYMGWNECTYRDAVGYANAGVVAIGVGSDSIMLIEPQTDKPAASDAVAASASNAVRATMSYYAYSSNTTTKKNTTNRPSTLDKLIKKFPHGKYWNHKIGDHNNPDKYTEIRCKHGDSEAEAECNEFIGSKQCLGFANKCGYDATNYSPNNKTIWKWYEGSAQAQKAMDILKPGDILTYYTSSGTHTIYVTGVSGDRIVCGDCNGAGESKQCMIQWNKVKSKSEIFSNFCRLKSAPKRLDT